MGIFGQRDGGPVDVPATPQDTGVRAEGPFLVAFDLEDRQEYSILATRVIYVADAGEQDTDAQGTLAKILVDDTDGGVSIYVSLQAPQVRNAWQAALASCPGWGGPS